VASNYPSHAARDAVARPWLVTIAAAIVTIAALALLVVHPTTSHAAPAKAGVVSTAKSSLGRILVDSRGRTLYLFQKDRHGKSACSGQCAINWPPLISSGKPRATAGAKSSMLGTTKRADGRLQVTYNRHPLYTFVKDTKKGQTNGEGLNAFGANWYVMTAAGVKIDKDASSSSSSNGYGP
jgi:predicted lipoprotein with Yx(FWY)xxD motif